MSVLKTGVLVVLIAMCTAGPVSAQSPVDVAAQLRASAQQDRMKAFYTMLYSNPAGIPSAGGFRVAANALVGRARKTPAIVADLIQLAEREQAIVQAAQPRSLSEEYVSYYGDVIGVAAALKDPRAVKVLINAIETGGMAINGLAALGEAAASSVIQAAASRSPLTRSAAILTLGKMALQRSTVPLSDATFGSIREVLLKSLNDSAPYVRLNAVAGLEPFNDVGVTRALAVIAEKDSYSVKKNGTTTYPVRDAAHKRLSRVSVTK